MEMMVDFIMYLEMGHDMHYVPINSDTDKLYQNKTNIFLNSLDELKEKLRSNQNDTSEELMFHFYEVAKKNYGTDKKSILSFFRMIYRLLFNTEDGPRLGTFVCCFGKENFINFLEQRILNPWNLCFDHETNINEIKKLKNFL